MRQQLSIPYNAIYPDWHYQPLRLLKAEISNPMGVITEFFSAYRLPEARKRLKEMPEDAMCNVDMYAINYLSLCEMQTGMIMYLPNAKPDDYLLCCLSCEDEY